MYFPSGDHRGVVLNRVSSVIARSSGRRREVAIRLVMGASQTRLVGQLLTENVLLSLISGVLALVTVFFLKNAIISLAPADTPRLNEVDLSAGVLCFALLLSTLTGVLFGLVPALQAANPNQVENLREGSRGSGLGRRHTRLSRFYAARGRTGVDFRERHSAYELRQELLPLFD